MFLYIFLSRISYPLFRIDLTSPDIVLARRVPSNSPTQPTITIVMSALAAAPSPEPTPTMASLSSPRGPKTIKFNKDSSINVSNSAASGTRGGAKATLVSAAGKDGSVHSFSLEEASAFTEHLNQALG